jgi:hypothetical protein
MRRKKQISSAVEKRGLKIDVRDLPSDVLKPTIALIRSCCMLEHGYKINKGLTDDTLSHHTVTVWFKEAFNRNRCKNRIQKSLSQSLLGDLELKAVKRISSSNNVYSLSNYRAEAC